MHTWSKTAWGAIAPVFEKITGHPFLVDLMSGVLEQKRFLFYLNQDALYLDDFGKVLAGIAVRSPNRRHVEEFLRFSADTIAVERDLHRSYLGRIDSTARPCPTCLLYTSFMHRQLAVAPLEVAVASVLPCFWVYQAVGDFILSKKRVPDNPYQSWIDTYGGEEYGKAVAMAVAIADELADRAAPSTRDEMTRAFVLCTRMEWMFWDAAWRLEEWPV